MNLTLTQTEWGVAPPPPISMGYVFEFRQFKMFLSDDLYASRRHAELSAYVWLPAARLARSFW
jgi:hypothetical protein